MSNDSSQEKPPSPPVAWQPLTPRGVAAFAQATSGRLFLVELLVALLGASAVAWFLVTAWFPDVRAAIHGLPEQGEIRAQELRITTLSTEPLAPGRFLAFLVDLDNQSHATPPADVTVEFRRRSLLICSLFGCMEWAYPRGWIIQLNRRELEPWWGAWQPTLLGGAVLLSGMGLLVTWALLAALYAPAVWLWSYFKDRQCGLAGSWRLASAALMPGALFLIGCVVGYGCGWMDLIRLVIAFVLHFVVGWLYLFLGLRALPRLSAAPARPKNPFASGGSPEAPTAQS